MKVSGVSSLVQRFNVQRLDKSRKRLGIMLKASCATLEPLNPEPNNMHLIPK
jgi:hypothetical protein